MSGVEFLLLFGGSLTVAAVCRKLNISAPLVILAVGLAVSFIPGIPEFQLQPDLVLLLILPPLLYSASLDSSYLNLKAAKRPIALLAVALVLVTTVVVGFAAHWLIPALPLSAAFVLGAVVAPPDAVAAVAIGRRLGLPRRLMTLLSGESLGNDATALTAFKVAVAAAVGTGMSFAEGIGLFLLATFGGLLVGWAIGWVVHRIRIRINDPVLESAIGLIVPFGTYLIAEEIHVSGVLAVVIAGLYLGHNAPRAGYATRLQEYAVWRSVDVLLESMVFALIGLQLRHVVSASGATWAVFAAALGLLGVAILVRVAWMFPAAYLPRMLVRRKEDQPGWRNVAVLSWTGMRGVVSLAAAAAIPAEMPESTRGTIIFVTFVITVGTLLIQGLTLPGLIKRLGVQGNEQQTDRLAEAQVKHDAAQAALDQLAQRAQTDEQSQVLKRIKAMTEARVNAVWENLGRQDTETPAAKYRRIRRELIDVERATFLAARDNGDIDDEVFRRVQRELDQDEAALDR